MTEIMDCDGPSEVTCMIPITGINNQPGSTKFSEVNINFSGLSYYPGVNNKGKNKKEVLKQVNGNFRAGCLNVIIGPSGAGKTSLLATICGVKTANVKGIIRVNNTVTPPEILRKMSCYIPQEFDLMPCLTARETIYFAARLKIIEKTEGMLHTVIEEVADKLGLQQCLETIVARLSGGEKKRLSIAVEIVTNPKLLFLDEPTSGLDSAASNQVMRLLKNMANLGCTIVCSVHQPNSYMITLFDEILVLSEGRELYCGPQKRIIETFREAGFACPPFYNIGEFVIEVATGQREGDLDILRKLSKKILMPSSTNSSMMQLNGEEIIGENSINLSKEIIIKEKRISCIEEFKVLSWRALMCIRRDNTMTILRPAVHIVIGFLLGAVFYQFGKDADKIQSNIACYFFFLMFLFFANAMPAVQMFPVEAAVFLREYQNHWYRLGPYYIAKVITDLPLQILNPALFLLIAYPLTGQPGQTERFLEAFLICFLLTVLAQSFGILNGAAFNTHIGCFLVPAINIPMILFAGFFLKLGEVPIYLRFFSAISFFRYSFEGFIQAIYLGNRNVIECSTNFCIPQKPERILKQLDMPTMAFSSIILILIIWIFSIQVLIYIVLKWKFIDTLKNLR